MDDSPFALPIPLPGRAYTVSWTLFHFLLVLLKHYKLYSRMPSNQDREEEEPGIKWLAFCALGMVLSLALYGVVLEYATSGGNKLHELSFVFVTTFVYTITAFVFRLFFGEKQSDIPKRQMLVLGFTSLASTYTSVRSLRYVIFPVQILFKSCKPVPVMAFGVALGKKYPFKKYVNVIIITTGVALFMGGGTSASKHSDDGSSQADMMGLGILMLTLSLCFDGATGAYEDKLMGNDHIGPFDLMYNIQFGKAVISFVILIITNQLGAFVETLQSGGITLIFLGLSGALGQVFIFLTISKFGALNCALIGLIRKLLTLALSFVLYKHSMNGYQVVGLCLAVLSMFMEFSGKGKSKSKSKDFDAKAPSPDWVDENGNSGDEQQTLLQLEMTEMGEPSSSSENRGSSNIGRPSTPQVNLDLEDLLGTADVDKAGGKAPIVSII
jgi:solute carrier family 35 (UDP-galactose transporter), member B1